MKKVLSKLLGARDSLMGYALMGAAMAMSQEASAQANIGAQAGGGAGLTTMVGNLKGATSTITNFISYGGGAVGVMLIVFGIYKGYEASKDHAQVKTKEIITPLIIGGALLSVSAIVGMMSETVGGTARVGTAVTNF